MKNFDIEDVFEVEDYLYFYNDILHDERTDQEISFLIKNLPILKSHNILDIPCGFGRHTDKLAEYGCKITGIDYMPGFIDMAKKRLKDRDFPVEYLVGDIREIDYDAEFDIVLNLFTSFGFFDDQMNRIILKKLSKALKKGGFFCIETINRDVLLKNFKECIVKKVNNDYMIDNNNFDYLTGRIYTERIICRDEKLRVKNFFIRLYNPSELANILNHVGLKVKDILPGFQKEILNGNSSRMLLIAEKVQ